MEKAFYSKIDVFTVVLLSASFLTSLFYKGVYGDFLFFSYVFLALASLLQVFTLVKKDKLELPLGPFVYLILAFWTLAFINLFFTISFFSSYTHLWVLGAFPFVFLLLITSGITEKDVNKLFVFLSSVVLFVAVWALYQIFTEPEPIKFRAIGPFFNPNSLAGLLNLFLLPLMALLLTAKSEKKSETVILFITVTILLAASMATIGRGAALCALMAYLLLIAFIWRRPEFKTLYAILISLLGAAFYWFFHIFYYSFKKTEAWGASESVGARMQVWEKSFEMFLANPFQGYGLANFQFVYPQFRYDTEVSMGYFVHMDPLQFAVEMGFMGSVLFYALLIAGGIRMLKVLSKKNTMLKAIL